MGGPNFDLMRHVLGAGMFAIIASGGVGDLTDLDALSALGVEAVVIGRALYEGRFDVAEAIGHLQT